MWISEKTNLQCKKKKKSIFTKKSFFQHYADNIDDSNPLESAIMMQ